MAVILNIEEDHLDFFSGIDEIKASFRKFAELVPKDRGCVVANMDDRNTMDAIAGIDRRVMTFGLTDKADVYAGNIVFHGDQSEFDAYYRGEFFQHIVLQVPGIHNVKNALAATAAAICVGISPNPVKYGLAGFNGADAALNSKANSTERTYTTTMPTIQASSRRCLTPSSRSATSASSPSFSRTHTRAPRLCSTISSSSSARPDLTFLAEIYARAGERHARYLLRRPRQVHTEFPVSADFRRDRKEPALDCGAGRHHPDRRRR